ncbi:MAG: hypothetical protein ACK6CP_16640 [Pseudanabaena sp.]|nr:hypothetical protein [Pseudanabaena sp. 42896M_M3]
MQTEPPPRKLLDRVRDRLRAKHYSYRTEETYKRSQYCQSFYLDFWTSRYNAIKKASKKHSCMIKIVPVAKVSGIFGKDLCIS